MAAPEAAPLSGVRVLVTRPPQQSQHLIDLIRQAGGSAIAFPVIDIAEPADAAALRRVIDHLDEYDIAVFISPNAVTRALNLIHARRGALPAGLRLAAVGAGSARELRRLSGGEVLAPTARADSEALLALPEMNDVRDKRIVIFRGEGGRELLADTLAARGARVEHAECYRRVRPDADVGPLLTRWSRGEIDVVVVTSAEGLRNLFEMLGKLGSQWLLRTPLVVIHPRIAQTARELGFRQPPMVAREAGDEAIVEAIRTWRAGQNPI
jgi:uroporphyrinogen-III synthase